MKRNIIPFIQLYCLLFITMPLVGMKKFKKLAIDDERTSDSEVVHLNCIYDKQADKLRQFVIGSSSEDISQQLAASVNQISDIKIGRQIFNCNALMGVAIVGNKNKCRHLIRKLQAKVNKQNNEQRTALSFAAEYGHLKIVKMLVQVKAKIDLSDDQKWSPLMYAAHHNRKKIVKFLLEHGSNPQQKNINHEKAINLTQNKNIKKLLATKILEQEESKLITRKTTVGSRLQLRNNQTQNPFYRDI